MSSTLMEFKMDYMQTIALTFTAAAGLATICYCISEVWRRNPLAAIMVTLGVCLIFGLIALYVAKNSLNGPIREARSTSTAITSDK